jgi:D-alanyl-D-alanine carboxypeptidase (penicillin-binding protein 5/6)
MKKRILLILAIIYGIVLHSFAEAKPIKSKKFLKKEAYLIIDQKTGKVLYNKFGNDRRYPASLTKMMTLYNVFDALEHKKLHMNQKIKVSSYAASKPRSKLGLIKGDEITVKDAILSLIVKSANDSAVVLAEAVSGTEPKFAIKMNMVAKKLGMKNSHFANASGLYDSNQYVTALDVAKLAIALKRDFPQYYNLFSRLDFEYKGRTIESHNHVTRLYPGAKGMKTGYINASGFNLVTTVERGDRHLVGVVLGEKTSNSRDKMMISMLDKHFINFNNSFTVAANDNNIKAKQITFNRVASNNSVKKETVAKELSLPISTQDEIGQIIAKVEAEEKLSRLKPQTIARISQRRTSKTPTPFLKSKLNKKPLRQASVK